MAPILTQLYTCWNKHIYHSLFKMAEKPFFTFSLTWCIWLFQLEYELLVLSIVSHCVTVSIGHLCKCVKTNGHSHRLPLGKKSFVWWSFLTVTAMCELLALALLAAGKKERLVDSLQLISFITTLTETLRFIDLFLMKPDHHLLAFQPPACPAWHHRLDHCRGYVKSHVWRLTRTFCLMDLRHCLGREGGGLGGLGSIDWWALGQLSHCYLRNHRSYWLLGEIYFTICSKGSDLSWSRQNSLNMKWV